VGNDAVRAARRSFAAKRVSLLAGNFFQPPSALRSRKSCNVMELTTLQSAGCGLAPARNREFQTTGTGTYQAISERIRERTGGRKRGAKSSAARLYGAARIPFPRKRNGAPHERSEERAPRDSCKNHFPRYSSLLRLGPAALRRNGHTQLE
jgi:hypothetical protein